MDVVVLVAILTCIGAYARERGKGSSEVEACRVLARWHRVVMWLTIIALTLGVIQKGWLLYFGG